MLLRLWKNWRRKARLLGNQHGGGDDRFLARQLFYPELQEQARSGQPQLQPYEGLSQIWQEYASRWQPDYAPFLDSLAKELGLELHSVLDLACGTGTLAGRLAPVAEEVVGIDSSEPMLVRAREMHSRLPSVRFVHGDFRQFQLNRHFDAAICAFNSLNYLQDARELRQMLDSVAKHLRSDGLFLFDTVTEQGMQALSGHFAHLPVGTRRMAMRCDYDLETRRETVQVILPTGVETHRRIPIGAEELLAAAEGSELEVFDYFSDALFPGRWLMGNCCFAVLRKRP